MTVHSHFLKADILVEHEGWQDMQSLVEKCFDTVTTKSVKGLSSGLVTLLFTTDEAVQELNRSFRNIDTPTNVLSFPGDDSIQFLPDQGPRLIGEVAFAFETCKREAEQNGISLQDHTAHLILHGTLHLFGYDHLSDDEAEVMEKLETELLADMGIADPYRQMERQ